MTDYFLADRLNLANGLGDNGRNTLRSRDLGLGPHGYAQLDDGANDAYGSVSAFDPMLTIACRSILTLLVALGPRLASAQTLPAVSEFPAVRTGNMIVVPAAILSGGHDSNIHGEGPPAGPIASTELFGVVAAQLFGVASSLEFTGASGAEIVSFRGHPGEGGLSWAHRFGVRLALPKVRPKASVRYSDTYARPTGFEIGARSRHQELTVTGGLDVRVGARARIGGEVSYLSIDYAADAIYQDSSLHDTLSLDMLSVVAQMQYDVSPLTTLSIAASADRNRFRRMPERDTDGGLVSVGVTLARPALVTGSGQVGFRWFRALSNDANTFRGLTGLAHLVYARPGGTVIAVRFARDPQFSYDPSLAYYVYTDVGGTISTRPGGWILKAGAGHQFLDYRYAGTVAGAGRVDHRTGVGAVIGHRVGRGMEVGVNAEYTEKTGVQAFNGTRLMAYWSIGGPYLMRFDRMLPGELP
jgi:hypothetical protein